MFLIARRLMPDAMPRVPFAIAAALLLWLPYAFFAGSFMEQSFLSQAVSELFAVAMWWALVAWERTASRPARSPLFALFGAAAFLTWPIWIGPLAADARCRGAVCTASCRGRRRVRHAGDRDRCRSRSSTAIYGADAPGLRLPHGERGRLRDLADAARARLAVRRAGGAGLAWAAIDRRARTAALLFAAIALQAAALIVTGRSSGAAAPYLSLKMAYLAIYPLSVAAAVMIANAWRAVACRRRPPSATPGSPLVLVALGAGRALATAPRIAPVVTQPVFLAGRWAQAHVPPACVDYLVADGYTGYWLHLAVLGNPRAAGRTLVDDTFEPRQAIVRWIVPGGLPYAIADDLDALPRDIRDERRRPRALRPGGGRQTPRCRRLRQQTVAAHEQKTRPHEDHEEERRRNVLLRAFFCVSLRFLRLQSASDQSG